MYHVKDCQVHKVHMGYLHQSCSVVDPGFTKGGGGWHNILDLLSLLPHIYKNKTTRWEVVKIVLQKHLFF